MAILRSSTSSLARYCAPAAIPAASQPRPGCMGVINHRSLACVCSACLVHQRCATNTPPCHPVPACVCASTAPQRSSSPGSSSSSSGGDASAATASTSHQAPGAATTTGGPQSSSSPAAAAAAAPASSEAVPVAQGGGEEGQEGSGEPGRCPICVLFEEGGCKEAFDVSAGAGAGQAGAGAWQAGAGAGQTGADAGKARVGRSRQGQAQGRQGPAGAVGHQGRGKGRWQGSGGSWAAHMLPYLRSPVVEQTQAGAWRDQG